MKYIEIITKKLEEHFSPSNLKVIDESELHIGHSGARPGGETHFKIEMESKSFEGKSRLECQREVYTVLKKELAERIHALTLQLSSPSD